MEQLETAVLIAGASPSGIMAGITSSRLGAQTLLVSLYQHIGGVHSNGLSVWDSHYLGNRSWLIEEFLNGIQEHYRAEYGEDSPQYASCLSGPFGGGRWPGAISWEPGVAESVYENMIARESNLTVVRGFYPAAVERANRLIKGVIFESFDDDRTIRIEAQCYVDATYEGDVAALAGVPYRVGREGREDYNEQFAGKLFVGRSNPEEEFPIDNEDALQHPRAARSGRLNLRPWWGVTTEVFSESTGEADDGVQAYNHRVILSSDPNNRRYPDPPEGYNRDFFLPITKRESTDRDPEPYPIKSQLLLNELRTFPGVLPIPNRKCDWNITAIPGANKEYPDGDWETRHAIVDRHRRHALGLLYFLQNDEAVPEIVREQAMEWGLPLDEFEDNDNFPREIYIREARRIVGRKLFTEHDARIARGLKRAPIHTDSIAIAEWMMDSHDCTEERVLGSQGDGFFCLSELTRPSQVPLGVLLPEHLDNLVVSVCVSATHVGWGTLREEPSLMSIGEAAGAIVGLAFQYGASPTSIPVEDVQRWLIDNGHAVAFFNDFDMGTQEDWVAPIQYLAAKGFFTSYDADPKAPLGSDLATRWARRMGDLIDGDLEHIRPLVHMDLAESGDPITRQEWLRTLNREFEYRGLEPSVATTEDRLTNQHISRAEACEDIFTVLTTSEYVVPL